MTTPWHTVPMRIAALQCNYENGRTLEVIDTFVEAGFNVEQLFHPMAESYTAIFDPARHGELLAEYLQRARSQGLRIILYQNVHIISPSKNDRHEEWATRSREGVYPQLYGTYYGCCVNSTWRDYFFGVLEALAPYELDGLFLDGPSVRGCYCPACRDKYERIYGGDLLSAANPAAFLTRSRSDFVREVYDRFKRLKPDALCYWNFPVLGPTGSHASLVDELPCNDILGTEGGFMFYGPAKDAYLWKPSLAAKALEALAPAKPRVVFMAADQKPWSWYPHTPVETQLCIASSVANGAGIWYGLHGPSRLMQTPGGTAAAELMRFLAKHEEYYTSTTSAARVAVMFSYDTERSYRSESKASDFYGEKAEAPERFGNSGQAFEGICDVLARSGIAFDVITDFELTKNALARYDCVLLSTCACLSEHTNECLRTFVANGGSLIATFDTSLYGPEGEAQPDFGLADVFGASYAGNVTTYANFNYFSAGAQDALFKGIEIEKVPAPAYGLDVEVCGPAKVIARFHQPQGGRYTDPTPPDQPAIIANRFGKGRSLYLAGTFGEMCYVHALVEYRRLIANAVRSLTKPGVELEKGLGNVEVVVRRQGKRLLVHLVNYAGILPRPFERVAPQQGLQLRIPTEYGVRSARALMAGKECAIESGPPNTTINLPTLDLYELIVLETTAETPPST